MSMQCDQLPINITLSYGNVSFHLSPSAGQDQLQSPRLLASPRAAHRRRSQRRNQLQRASYANESPNAHSGSPNAEQQPPIVSIRRGKSEQQPQASSHFSSKPSSATNTNDVPPSPMRQHIIGRVRAMKERIEVEERRQSGSMYNQATGLNTSTTPGPQSSQPMSRLSGYCVDLHSFTGTLQIVPNMSTATIGDNTRGFNCSNATASDYVVKNSPGYEVQSPRKRIVKKSNRRDKALKRSKTRSFTWIASNESEVEIGFDRAKSPSSQDQFMADGIDSEKKFDFVDVSESENEREEDVESVNLMSAEKSVKFSFGADSHQRDVDTSQQSSENVTNESSGKLTTTSSSKKLQTNGESAKKKEPKSSPIPPQSTRSIDDTKPRANGSLMKARTSFSTPPKLLQYAQQAMKQMGLTGKEESYNMLGSDPVLGTIGSSLRSWDAVTGDQGYSDNEGTQLHYACASLDVSRIHRVLESTDAHSAMKHDSKGRLPIHVLAENYDLITDNPAECEDIVDIFCQIMGPDTIVQSLHGSSGWGPFVGIIGRWCEDLHKDMHSQQSGQLAFDSLQHAGENLARARTTFTQQLPLFRAVDKSNERVLQSSLFMKDREKAFFLPYSVVVNDHVKWAIRVLSNLIDLYPEQTREAILTNILSTVPSFLKCIFLINDAEEMTELTEMPLIKHAAIDKRSINVWLIAMLTSTNKEVQMRAVVYLKLLSRLTLTDLAASSQYRDKFSDTEIKRFVSLRRDTFDALYSMPGIFPAVLGLGGRGIESLSTTRVMRYITDRTIRKEKQFFRLICDFFYGALLMLGFRLQVEFVFTENHRDGPAGGYRDHNYWSLSTWALAFYFLVKDLLSLLSLYMTATKLAKRYCTHVFNMIDMAAVLILVIEGGPFSDDSISMRDGWAASLVTILLWLRLMGAFKILNQSFALFLYAVWEVIKEIKWFIVFLFMVTVMFSDAARAAVVVTADCSSEEYASTDFCSGGFYTVVRMYSILVGGVEVDYFGSSTLMVAVFFFFSLFCIIILLNILIAIIIESYERTKQRSREIFGRAQVEYAAALVARNQFIRPKEISEFHVASFVPHVLRRFLRLSYIIVYAGALVLFEYGFAGAIIYLKRFDSSEFAVTYNLILVYIIVGSIFNAYIFSFAIITLLNWSEQINPSIGIRFSYLKRALETAVLMFHRVMGFNSVRGQLDLTEDVLEH